jgi:hypothetical protein
MTTNGTMNADECIELKCVTCRFSITKHSYSQTGGIHTSTSLGVKDRQYPSKTRSGVPKIKQVRQNRI